MTGLAIALLIGWVLGAGFMWVRRPRDEIVDEPEWEWPS